MKKYMKKICVIFAIAITLMQSGCIYKSWFGKRPCDQPNSEWISDDKSISFYIDQNGSGTGKMIIDKEPIDIHVAIGPATEINIYPLKETDDLTYGEYLEYWIGTFNESDTFSATVKETTFFEVGDEISFYRIVEDGAVAGN